MTVSFIGYNTFQLDTHSPHTDTYGVTPKALGNVDISDRDGRAILMTALGLAGLRDSGGRDVKPPNISSIKAETEIINHTLVNITVRGPDLLAGHSTQPL